MNIKYLDLHTINRPYEHAADEVLRSDEVRRSSLKERCQRMWQTLTA